MTADTLRVWCFGCAHVVADLRRGREGLADAIRDAEQWQPTWDIGLKESGASGKATTVGRATGHCVPKSCLVTFTEGSAEARVRCYPHTSEFLPKGWRSRAEQTLELGSSAQMGWGMWRGKKSESGGENLESLTICSAADSM
jgi:hypothetical protein